MVDRTFGWIQDPGKLDNLRRVVDVFCPDSNFHGELRKNIRTLASSKAARDSLTAAISRRPLSLTFRELVGSGDKTQCNGLVQMAVSGQRRPFISHWAADNFVRWAHALGFIQWDAAEDDFKVTEAGMALSATKEDSDGEYDAFTGGFLQYPPVARILNLLAEATDQDKGMTKFAIGQKLGFKGEKGFTSISEAFFIHEYVLASPAEKRQMRDNWEGDSDKYARMICSWLQGLKYPWIRRTKRNLASEENSCILSCYALTKRGYEERKKTIGISSTRKISKFVPVQMLCTKGAGRTLLRKRRALILDAIRKKAFSVKEISAMLNEKKLTQPLSAIENDICGLENIGLTIERQPDNRYRCRDKIFGLEIPEQTSGVDGNEDEEIRRIMEACREQLKCIPESFVELVQMAFNRKQSLMFEIKVMELLTNECAFNGRHLGGGSRPDGIIYHENFGVIIDTKSYANGFSIPVGERDKMGRYVYEAKNKPKDNATLWWENFPSTVIQFLFLFVSGKFTGNFRAQLKSLGERNECSGAAISAVTLLLTADKIAADKNTREDFKTQISCLDEVELVPDAAE